MKRLLAAALCLCLALGMLVLPARGTEPDVVIDSRDSAFPADTTVAGDMRIGGDCPDTVILINVEVLGTLYIEADHAVTVRMQGSSRAAALDVGTETVVIGGSFDTVTVRTRYAVLEDAQAGAVTVDAPGAVFTAPGSHMGTLTLEQADTLAGGEGCTADSVVKNGENSLFSGTAGEITKQYDDPQEPSGEAENHGVEGVLRLERSTVSPAASVVRAKLSVTHVPEDMVGDYRLYWYFGDMFAGSSWHVTLADGMETELECSVHFDGVMDRLPIWVEMIRNDDSEATVRFVTSVQVVDYSTAAYQDIEETDYPYQIHLLRNQNVIIIYGLDEQGKYTRLVNAFVCSVGYYNPTPTGEYEINLQMRWGSLMTDLYGQYSSQFNGNMLFHSVPYRSQELFNIEYDEYNKLGEPASSGCVRMSVADAKWIYTHCRKGTKVEIYDTDTLPVEKPVHVFIDEESRLRGWDPTDPSEDNPTRADWVPEISQGNSRLTDRLPGTLHAC